MADLNLIQKVTYWFVFACKGNPVNTTVVIMLFYIFFNLFEAAIENVIFGKRFEHIFDLIFCLTAIGYAAYAVYWCAIFNQIHK